MAKSADALADYHAKRDFTATREPKGGGRRRTKPSTLRFVVQKHDATRLHFDFRLELDGVLKSWAVTRGPSTDPADKRLAVRVEDHPLDYGGFEGTIPKGQYGGGTVMLWDEGTWEPIGDAHEGLEKGDLKFRLHGQRMQGEWVLVHMKGRDSKTRNGPRENWLLIKHHDEFATEGSDLVERYLDSVRSGRDFAAIAAGDAVWETRPKGEAAVPAAKTPSKTEDPAPLETPAAPARKPRARKASGAAKLPAFRAPMLATLVKEVPAGDDWLFEMKFDGYRCIAAIAGEGVQLFTRNGNDWTETFQTLVAPLSRLTKGTLLLDGEVCAIKDGKADFSALKDALGAGGALSYFVFDILEEDGKSLEHLPQIERKQRLHDLLGDPEPGAVLRYSDHIAGHGAEVFRTMCEAGQEGVIAKRADAAYVHERSANWLKIKCTKRQEFVIGGWRPSGKKSTFASLLVGTMEDGKLVYRGRVGTGFNEAGSERLQAELDGLERKTPAFDSVPREIAADAHWTKPVLVAEIDFTELTPQGHLRHPSFIGLRGDKPAKEIGLERPAEITGGKTMPKRSASSAPGTPLDDAAGIAAARGAGVTLTHPERRAYQETGPSKAQLVAYYAAVAPRMLAHLARRPLSLVRVPHGGHPFFQKHDAEGLGAALKRVEIAEKDGDKETYLYAEDLGGIASAVQMNTLEFHIWGSHVDTLEQPDRIIFDIDPDEGLGFDKVRDAALDIRERLAALGLESFAMVTGGKGIHVIAPLAPVAEWPAVKAFCSDFAHALAEDAPDRFTANLRKAERHGRMFVDYLRNQRGSTAVAPFSTRARPGVTCAVPVGWDEVPELAAANGFDIEAAAARAAEADPWPTYFDLTQVLPEAAGTAGKRGRAGRRGN